MKIDRVQMKADAKAVMRTKKRPSVYVVTLVFLLVMWVLNALITRLILPNVSMAQLAVMDAEQIAAMMRQYPPGFIGSILSLAIQIMSVMLCVGFASFCLNAARGLDADFRNLFDEFDNFFNFLLLNILIGIFTFLWSLLFIIPGIIASYRYSMAVYIMLDDPDKSAMQCIRESKEMTRGYKGQLFVLDLSFLGWSILSAIPFVCIYTMPYMELTKANYYRAISGRAGAPAHFDYNV